MNFHYVEFMIKERRRQELEDCQKIHLLKAGGYSDAYWIKRIVLAIRTKLHKIARQASKSSTLKSFHFETREVL